MLDIKFIREHSAEVKEAARVKGESIDIDHILQLDARLTVLKKEMQELQTQRNAHAKKIPAATKEERPALIEQGREIGAKIDAFKPKIVAVEEELARSLYLVPAIPDPRVPVGAGEEDNVEVKKEGKMPKFSFKPRSHIEILELNDWAEFERIAEVCGSRSFGLKNEMLLLELAVHRQALEHLRTKGFTLISTPSLVREAPLYGTGHFPVGRDQVYHLAEDDLYLSGTSEVQINSLHGGEILKEDQLPLLYAGYSSCFRREAGSHGKDVKGLIRVHQFTKVEQYIICKNDPDESEKWHRSLLETSEEIVRDLELPYRVVECCTGDMGSGKVRMFDVECFVPSEEKYRETHSCSSLHDWQARRTNTRYRDSEGQIHFVHTLNNTAVATPRILVSLLECHQREDGSINIPAKLRPYLGDMSVLKAGPAV